MASVTVESIVKMLETSGHSPREPEYQLYPFIASELMDMMESRRRKNSHSQKITLVIMTEAIAELLERLTKNEQLKARLSSQHFEMMQETYGKLIETLRQQAEKPKVFLAKLGNITERKYMLSQLFYGAWDLYLVGELTFEKLVETYPKIFLHDFS